MIKYEIEGGSLPVLICHPEAGETIVTQRGAMSWMSPNMIMDTNTGGGIKKMFGRMFTGESLFLNEYTAEGGEGMIALATTLPGRIIPFEVTPGNAIVVQKGGFLAMEKGLDMSVFFQKKIGVGFFGGEGFLMQKISGTGMVFVEIDGYCKEYDLAAGESIILDTGYLAAMSETCSMEIQSVSGIKNVFLGGEGLFLTKVTGPGRVYVQSLPIQQLAKRISPYIEVASSSSSSDSNSSGGININVKP